MALTPAQLTTLRAAIDADPVLSAYPRTADGYVDLATVLNRAADPAFTVWKTRIPINEVGKAFVASSLSAATSANNERLNNFAQWNNDVDPSRADQRQFFDDVFSVASGAPTRTALAALWRRLATRVEALFATGTGSDASPATMTVEGSVSAQDVETARNL
jgi:hypothetical protein